MDYNVVVDSVGETRLLDARNQPVRAYRFTFRVGTHGPFTMDFTSNELETGAVRTKLQAFANQIQAAAS